MGRSVSEQLGAVANTVGSCKQVNASGATAHRLGTSVNDWKASSSQLCTSTSAGKRSLCRNNASVLGEIRFGGTRVIASVVAVGH